MATIQICVVWVRKFFFFRYRTPRGSPRAAKSDPRRPKLRPKGGQERHQRSPRAARSMAPMAPIQIGAIWVHDFVCFLQIPSAPR